MEKISHKGSFSTITDFTLENGNHVRIVVWFKTEYTSANQGTYYVFNLYTKGKGCRNWIIKFNSKYAKDERSLEYISEEQLYTSFYNHWIKLNPIRIFSNGSINGEYVNFTVSEKQQESKHFQF